MGQCFTLHFCLKVGIVQVLWGPSLWLLHELPALLWDAAQELLDTAEKVLDHCGSPLCEVASAVLSCAKHKPGVTHCPHTGWPALCPAGGLWVGGSAW